MAKTLKQFYYRVSVINNDGSISEQTLCPNGGTGFAGFFGQEFLTEGSISHKISIQGPPGLVIELNDKSLILGRSGIYDFDNRDIDITSIQIPKPQIYYREDPDPDEVAAVTSQLSLLHASVSNWIQTYDTITSLARKEGFCKAGIKIENTNYKVDDVVIAQGFNLLNKYIEVCNGTVHSRDNEDITNVTVNFIEEPDESQGGV